MVWEGGQLIDWRWGSLIKVLQALLRRQDCLRAAWDIAAFGDTEASMARTVDQAMKSDFFWAYARFLSLLAGSLDLKSQWTEGCVCCGAESERPAEGKRRHGPYQTRKKAIAAGLRAAASPSAGHGQVSGAGEAQGQSQQPSASQCKLKGRRAAEYAQGEFLLFAEEVKSVAASQLEECITTLALTDHQKALLTADWLSATATRLECQTVAVRFITLRHVHLKLLVRT